MVDPPGKNIGRGFLAAGFLGAIALMTLFFGDLEERQTNPNRAPASQTTAGRTEVMLARNRAEHYVVTGTINGVRVDFLLDTGATDVVVPADIADELGLQYGRKATAMTANGPISVYQTEIDHLTIGAIELTNLRASINPAMAPYGILLGMSALERIEFVQRGEILTLRQYND